MVENSNPKIVKVNLYMKLLKNPYIVAMVTKINIVVLTFINSVIINRYLGPTLMGEYSYIVNVVNILSLILALSFTQALPYFMKKYGNEVEKDFVNIIYVQAGLYLIIALLINLIYPNEFIMTIMVLGIITQFYQQISFVAIIKNLNQKNILTIINTVIYTFFLFIVLLMDNINKLNIIIYAYVLKMLLGIALHVFKQRIFPIQRTIKVTMIKEILFFSFFPAVTSLLITLNYRIDIIILEFFVNFTNIGIYSLAVTLAGMLWIIPDAFKDVLFNKTAKSDSIKDIVFSIKFNTYISVIVIIVFLIIGKHFISIIYGIEYINSYYVTLLLLIGNIPMVFFKMINTLYISNGKQKMAMYILLLAVVSNVIGNILLIPIFSIEGAAIASILSYSITGIVFLLSFKRNYDISLNSIILLSSDEIHKFKYIIRRKR